MECNYKRFIFILFALLLTGSAFSQVPDTVVVYEYVYVTDTVWVERDAFDFKKLESITNAALLLDTTTMKACLSIFSSGKTATIPINRIILTENNQKLKSMKKLTFLGLILFALNNASFAQEDNRLNMGLYLKGNLQRQSVHYFELDQYIPDVKNTEFILAYPTPAFGINGNIPINPLFSFNPRIELKQMYGLTQTTITDFMGVVNDIDTYSLSSASSKFTFLSADFLLNCNLPFEWSTNYRLFGGVRTEYLVHKREGVESEGNYTNYNKLMASYVAGVGFDFRNRYFLELEYSKTINNFVDNDFISVKYGNISMTVGVYLF